MIKCSAIVTLQPKICFGVIDLLEQFNNLMIIKITRFIVKNEIKHENSGVGEKIRPIFYSTILIIELSNLFHCFFPIECPSM